MEKFSVLFFETRKQKVEVKAENEQDAIAQIKSWFMEGSLKPDLVCGMDFDVLDRTPLQTEKLQRFEILGEEALFTDMSSYNVYWLKGTENLYRYDLRHGDDDSYPQTVERHVTVNRFGTVFTTKPLLKENEESRTIGEDDWGFLSDLEDCTPEQFLKEMQDLDSSLPRKEYEILQLNRANGVYAFCNYSFLLQKDIQLDASCYDSVYKGIMEDGMNLESIFAMFNINRPEDFKGHSLSVSDVVVLHDGASKTAHFVDSFGFKELPGFFDTPVKAKEQYGKPANDTIKKTAPNEERT